MALGPLNIDIPQVPSLAIGDYVPDFIKATPQEPLQPNQPRAITSLSNKYAPGGYLEKLEASGQYAPHAINALRNYDQDRVKRGQAPLSEAETISALEAATKKTTPTEPAKRSLFNLPKNLVSDAGDILKSIPRLPGALINEVKSLPSIGQHIAEAKNPLVGLASAPGIRMLPGAFIAEQLAGGTPGELARHPLFTALDALPIGNELAKSTKVVRAAEEAARTFSALEGAVDPAVIRQGLASQQLAKRPLKTALLRTLDDNGNIIKNNRGELVQMVADTKLGKALSGTFGGASRDAMFAVNAAMQRTRMILQGTLDVPDNVLAPLAKDALTVQTRLDELGLNDRAAELVDRAHSGRIADVDEAMQEGIELVREWNGKVASALQQSNLGVMFDGEFYDLKQGLRLKEAERGVNKHRKFVEQRGRVEAAAVDPTVVNPTNVISDQLASFTGTRRRPTVPGQPVSAADRLSQIDAVSVKDLTLQHNVMIRQLRSAGFDTTELQQAWQAVEGRAGKRTKAGVVKGRVVKDPAVYESLLRELAVDQSRLPKLPMATLDEAVTKLKSLTRDPKVSTGVKDVLFGIENRNWKSITKGLESLRRTDLWNDEPLISRLREIRDTGRFIDQHLPQYTEKSLATKQKNLSKISSEAVPARFIPELERQTKLTAKERLIDINDVDQAEMVNRLADQGLWEDIPGFEPAMYRQVQRESARQWQQWRDDGLDPVYIHTVTPNRANAAVSPQTAIVPRSASSVKQRMWDMAPGVKNVSVAMNHQLMELVSRQQVEIAIKTIMDQVGETELSLRQRFAPAAQRRAATNTALDFEGHLQKIIGENYRRFDPLEEGYSWGSPYLDRLNQDGVFIPQTVAKNLKALAEPKRLLGGLLDPVTNVFRAATTSLSLRTQIYNVMGGGISLELQSPGALLRSGAKAREWMRNPEAMPTALREIVGSTKQAYMDLDREALGAVNEGVFHYLKGKTLRRMLGENDASKAGRLGQPLNKFKGQISGLLEKSYDLNSKVDDFYRMTSYIDAYDTAVKAGSSAVDAERKAVTAVRHNLQDWMSMTPVERSVIRSIIPFYGYMGHAMRFVLRYPFDHPLRTEMFTKLALSEMEDQSLPTRFLSMLFVGGLGSNGEQTAINAGPFNPFGDIANYMTIQGLMGATNPVISTLLEQVGIENGEAELYPSLRYDTATGRLSAGGKNLITNMLHNTLPQSQLVTALLGINEEYKDMARRDPAAASRYLASGLTIPIAWREVQVDQERMKSELARQDAQEKVKNEALKSGDWTEALMYPSLREYLDAITNLTPEQRAPFMQLSPEQLEAITSHQSNVQLPQFAGVEPLNTTVGNALLTANQRGGTIPGGSLVNTTGGT